MIAIRIEDLPGVVDHNDRHPLKPDRVSAALCSLRLPRFALDQKIDAPIAVDVAAKPAAITIPCQFEFNRRLHQKTPE